MRGVVWRGPETVEVDDSLPDPRIEHPRDAIVRVTLSAICGTDLHPYRGEIDSFRPGTVLGHEFVGVVEDVGEEGGWVRPGERVLASDVIACGRCWYCNVGLHYQCEHVSLFGYGDVVGPYVPGGQAERVRVPFADVVLSPIPPILADEQILLVGDVLTTGYSCAAKGRIAPGATVAVVGFGPVGACAAMSALLLGAARVLAVDPDESRMRLAERVGAVPCGYGHGAGEQVREETGGRGADVVLEAVGSDGALLTALDLVRAGGTVVAAGAHASEATPFPARMAFDKELTLSFAVGDPIATRDALVPLVSAGRLDPAAVISHRMPLEHAVEAYAAFDRREATKVVLRP